MGGAGISEYLRAGGVGPLTKFLSCCIDGGRDSARFLPTRDIGVSLDLGFVARRLFSCSNRANNNAVDYNVSTTQ
jgi:hypothetical protein